MFNLSTTVGVLRSSNPQVISAASIACTTIAIRELVRTGMPQIAMAASTTP
jgi:hypothetical protein